MPTTLLRILFHDLCNQPMPNLYHEIRENGRTISAGSSDGEGYGVWMRRRVGRELEIAIKDPRTRAMITLPSRIIVQKPQKGNAYIARVQAPCFTQLISLQPRQGKDGHHEGYPELTQPHLLLTSSDSTTISSQKNINIASQKKHNHHITR